MNLSELCIKRPVFTLAMMIVLVILGVVLFQRLAVRELPKMDKPVVIVSTSFTGADASLMENEVSTPLEDAIAGVNGIDYIQSKSRQGKSKIIVKFKENYDINVGMNDVRDKVSAAMGDLPKDVDKPVFYKADSEGNPAIVLSINDGKRSAEELTDYANRYLLPEVEQIDGVNNVQIWGARTYAMRIWLNPKKMAARQIAVNDVTKALEHQNTDVPGGEIQGSTRDYPVIANANIKSARQFSDLVINSRNGFITHFYDIANVKVGPADIDSAFRVKGHPGVALAIIPTSTANPVDVSNSVKEAMKHMQETLPPSMHLSVLFNMSNFIKASIHEVYLALIEALILVTIVVLLFLGSVRSTFIPFVTIPVCIISTFSLLFAFQYSINTITLLALVLAIGLVVDDAIVMLENIHRHIEEGMPRMEAAIKGSKEITFAVIAMTLTLVAVYLPITFTEGLTGIIFRQFALTLAGSVLISGFVALTLSPMMSSRVLASAESEGRYQKWLDRVLNRLTEAYKNLLTYCLHKRWWIVLIVVLFSGVGYLILQDTPSELAPKEDQGYFFVGIDAPTNSSFAFTDYYAKQAAQLYNKLPGMSNYFNYVGGNGQANSGFSMVKLEDWNKRKLSQAQISDKLNAELTHIPGIRAYAITPAPLGQRSSNYGVEFKLVSPMDFADLHDVGDYVVKLLSNYPGLSKVQNQLKLDNQQYDVHIKRNLAADMHVDIGDITDAIKTYIGQRKLTTFEYDGQTYDVLLQLPRSQREDLSAIKAIYLRNEQGTMVPLSMLINIKPIVGPLELPHYNRMRVDSISGEIAPGYSLGQVVTYLKHIGKTELPSGVQFTFSGSVKRFIEAKGHMMGVFILALIFIYLVLSAQFESFMDPFIVMLSVPLCLIGGLLILNVTGGTLNVFSEIALVTLIGLITKHGILIVDFANKQREQGVEKFSAVVNAAALRLRPILMTTAAMALGALPLAIASGPGSVARQQIGWVILGGMIIGTFFSLFAVPVAYLFLSKRPTGTASDNG